MPGLRGWLGQSLNGSKRAESVGYVANFGGGTNTWVCPKSGRYRVVQWGGGGGGVSAGGDGGGHAQPVRWIRENQVIVVELSDNNNYSTGATATVTFPDGTIVISTGGAHGGISSAPGTASGGDVNVSGIQRSGVDGGAAGSFGAFPGGRGGKASGPLTSGSVPGGGGSYTGSSAPQSGPGLVLIVLEAT